MRASHYELIITFSSPTAKIKIPLAVAAIGPNAAARILLISTVIATLDVLVANREYPSSTIPYHIL